MKARDIVFEEFSRFYKHNKPCVTEVHMREFGIGNYEKKIYRRHMTFFDIDDLHRYLIREAPLYISHSVAYYKYPDLEMEKKGWLGADLVFDLDSEAISRDALEKTKQDMVNLIDMVDDYLGAKRKLLVFSGNRGFHLHIRDNKFKKLGRNERLKLIRFLKGEGFDVKMLFETYAKKYKELLLKMPNAIIGPSPEDKGFGGLFAKKVIKQLEKLHSYFKDKENRERFIRGVSNHNWGIYNKAKIRNLFNILQKVNLNIFSLTIDPGVTGDISKLIRVPCSLHGSTGLWVMKIKDIEDFDPFYDPVVLSDELIEVYVKESIKIELKDFNKTLKKGSRIKIPRYVAIYLFLKNKVIF